MPTYDLAKASLIGKLINICISGCQLLTVKIKNKALFQKTVILTVMRLLYVPLHRKLTARKLRRDIINGARRR